MNTDDWKSEYRNSAIKSLYAVTIKNRACIAIYRRYGQLLFAFTVYMNES